MRKLLSFSVLLICLSPFLFSTDAVVTHNATLRGDPSSTHPPVLHLVKGDDVEILDSVQRNRYYHVRTGEGVEGWVYGPNVELITAPPAATSTTAVTSASTSTSTTGISSTISPNWSKPTPSSTVVDFPDGSCGPTGDGGDSFTNERKNRTDVPTMYHEVSWKALRSLPYPNAPRSLADWSPSQMSVIQPYEGIPVSVVGYLTAIKVEDRGTGESTNCHFVNAEEVDWHMPLVEASGEGEDTAIVVETTPRVRKTHQKWTPTNLSPWIKSTSPVRVSGFTLLDPEHRAHLGKYRSTLWEIHPITKIEVFQNGEWVDLDQAP